MAPASERTPSWTIAVLVARYVAIPIAIRTLKFLGWCVVALPLVMGLFIGGVFWHDSVVAQKRSDYHDQHPLLKSLYVASVNSDGSVSTHTPRASEAFLARVPLGARVDEFLSILAEEDIQCSRAGSRDTWSLACGISVTARDRHVPNWQIQMKLDQSDQLVHAEVWITK